MEVTSLDGKMGKTIAGSRKLFDGSRGWKDAGPLRAGKEEKPSRGKVGEALSI